MSDQIDDQATDTPDELALLKGQARMMGITFSNNISVETLRAKIAAKMEGTVEPVPEEVINPLGETPLVQETKSQRRQRLLKENMRLIRLRITNLDPKKKDLPGEILTVGNDLIGVVKKYIPFGEVTDNGYHVPYILYKMLDRRKFLNIRVRKDSSGREHVEQNWAKEFALEILPPLTPEELKRLAASQAAAGGL